MQNIAWLAAGHFVGSCSLKSEWGLGQRANTRVEIRLGACRAKENARLAAGRFGVWWAVKDSNLGPID